MATDAISSELPAYAGGMTGAATSFAGKPHVEGAQSTTGAVDQQQVLSAVQKLQAHFASRSAPPELKVDYLSGLSVVTVRTADTGEVLYQLPDTDAVRLARLIADGGAPASLGVLDTNI